MSGEKKATNLENNNEKTQQLFNAQKQFSGK